MNLRMVRVSVAVTLLQSASLVALLISTSQANAELQAKTAYADCEGKMEHVGVHAGPQGSTRLLQTLNCGEQVTVIGRADENDWFKVKTQQGVEGYVWMFLSDHQSAVSAKTSPRSRVYRTATGVSWFGIETGQSKATVERLLLKDGLELAACVSGKTPGGAPNMICFAMPKRIPHDLKAIKTMVVYPQMLFIHDELVSYKYGFDQSGFEAMADQLSKGFGAPDDAKKGWANWNINGGCVMVFLIEHEPQNEQGRAEVEEDESRRTDRSEVNVQDNCRLGELADTAN